MMRANISEEITAFIFRLKTESAYFSETLVITYQTARFHNSEAHNMNLRHCENLEYDRVNKLIAKLQVDLLEKELYETALYYLFNYLSSHSFLFYLYRCQYVSIIDKTALYEP
jgi:hypothetical protein